MKSARLQLSLERRQIMAFALQQSLRILQLSEMELAQWIQEEIESNPLIEEIPRANSLSMPIPDVAVKPTLREHLLSQARESLLAPQLAEFLIDQLDEKGFLSISLDEIPWPLDEVEAALAIIQTFDPPGIGARNLQEALLLQLKRNSYSLSEILVRDHFEDLLHSRFKAIQKRLGISPADFSAALNRISKLRMRPAEAFAQEPPSRWIADLIINESEEGWIVQVGEEELPAFRISESYQSLHKQCSEEEKETLKSWHVSARWLSRSIRRRREMLLRIGNLLLKKQALYFETGKGAKPIGIRELAVTLGVHPTTAWRAAANKMLSTPYGTVPLSNFFSESASKDPIKDLLRQLIKQEDKSAPHTDDALSHLLRENGLICARRTVSKYRKFLKIGSATQRKTLC